MGIGRWFFVRAAPQSAASRACDFLVAQRSSSPVGRRWVTICSELRSMIGHCDKERCGRLLVCILSLRASPKKQLLTSQASDRTSERLCFQSPSVRKSYYSRRRSRFRSRRPGRWRNMYYVLFSSISNPKRIDRARQRTALSSERPVGRRRSLADCTRRRLKPWWVSQWPSCSKKKLRAALWRTPNHKNRAKDVN